MDVAISNGRWATDTWETPWWSDGVNTNVTTLAGFVMNSILKPAWEFESYLLRDRFHLARARPSVIRKTANVGMTTFFPLVPLVSHEEVFRRLCPPARGTAAWIRGRPGGRRPLRRRRR